MVTLDALHRLINETEGDIQLNFMEFSQVAWLGTPISPNYSDKQDSFWYLGTNIVRNDLAANKF